MKAAIEPAWLYEVSETVCKLEMGEKEGEHLQLTPDARHCHPSLLEWFTQPS